MCTVLLPPGVKPTAVNRHIHPSIHPSYPSIYLSIHPSIHLSIYLFPKQHCFLEGSQASPVCPCDRAMCNQGWPTSVHWRATQFAKDSPEGCTCVCVHRERERERERECVSWINWKAAIYRHKVKLKVRLNDKAVGLTKLGKTKKKWFIACCLKSGVVSYSLSTVYLLIKSCVL